MVFGLLKIAGTFPAVSTSCLGTGNAPRLLPDAIYFSGWYKLHLLKLPSLSYTLSSSSLQVSASFIGFVDNFRMNHLLLFFNYAGFSCAPRLDCRI